MLGRGSAAAAIDIVELYPARTGLESLSNRGISRKLSSRAQIKAAKGSGTDRSWRCVQ